jgi:mono/diheme cytochrome c family protein
MEHFMKKTLILLILIAFAAMTAFAMSGGNPRKGRSLFKKNCKSCHVVGAEGGAISPLSKTMKQWDKFFKKGKHPGTIWESLSDTEKANIGQYLFDNAIDTHHPDKCG